MKRSRLPVIAIWPDENATGPQYFVGNYWEAGLTSTHVGPFTTEKEAWEWIDAVIEDKGYFQ